MVFGGGLDGDENRGLVGDLGGGCHRAHRADWPTRCRRNESVQFRLKKTRVGQGQVHPAVTRHFVPFGPDLLKLVDEDVEETALTTIERG